MTHIAKDYSACMLLQAILTTLQNRTDSKKQHGLKGMDGLTRQSGGQPSMYLASH